MVISFVLTFFVLGEKRDPAHSEGCVTDPGFCGPIPATPAQTAAFWLFIGLTLLTLLLIVGWLIGKATVILKRPKTPAARTGEKDLRVPAAKTG